MKSKWGRGCLTLLLACGVSMTPTAQTNGMSITISNSEVVNKVGGGLYTLTQSSNSENQTLVVVLGGSEGGYPSVSWPLVVDLLLAGHRVAPVAYHGADGTPKHLKEISIDSVSARIGELSELAGVSPGCVGIVGISKGGELTLLLASLTDIGDVHVAITPSDVVWQASNPSLRRKSSWTHSGQSLPFVEYPRFSRATLKSLRDVSQSGDLHELALQKTKNLDPTLIPVERANTPILLQAGSQDELWPTEKMSKRLVERLDASVPNHRVELKTYALGHQLSGDSKVRADALSFLSKHLDATCPDP